MRVLAINPGSTSTKFGVFQGEKQVFDQVLRHSSDALNGFDKVTDQYDFRKSVILDALAQAGYEMEGFDAVVGCGGLLKPIVSGTYLVNDRLMEDLKIGVQGEHVSNLGGLIANEIAAQIGIPAFIVDPVVVDEFEEISRRSGHPAFPRRSIFHALNQKATARRYCREAGVQYEDVNLVVAHMGGGISIGIHAKGRVIDANNALDGEGPFSPERSGTLPLGQVVALCFRGTHSQKEVKAMLTGKGGMVAYLGSNSLQELEKRAKTDAEVKLLIDAMIYQVAKEIAAMSTAVNGQVDAILLTGGICHSEYITAGIKNRVSFIADVKRYPGENELAALAMGAIRVLAGEEVAKVYE
ncbi:MAG: butyrate kinase [Oscillospiraceae bacterium]|nr:butyrate kinase [Oscillospiraceae bacterium]